ncbi:bifunctional non-homologous end joining protein LigD [Kutzneria buriramensis]|uniref:DNA ligase (ATP) n=1 Tax=Kutzneria buriramensis TaxID=1045776 RepID=A0A3E0I5K7_9PSEU|nr:bifunctional non-homologous end joining protein LigD [Kutzneria buriramensis]
MPDPVEPMLAGSDGGTLPNAAGWSYEFKWDGYRAIMRVAEDGTTRLNSRNLNDLNARYAELTEPGLGVEAILDGEVVALDARGVPDFSLLQNRAVKVQYFAFDVLRLGGRDLMDEPYRARRELLAELTPASPRISVTPYYDHADIDPGVLLQIAADSGLEGLVAKATNSRYHPGRRSPEWLKHPFVHTREVVLGGWRPGQGRRDGTIGALLLGAYDSDGLRYIGDVGTGFTDQALRDLQRQLEPLEQRQSPFANAVPRDRARHVHWLRPELVGDVEYRKFTVDRVLRHSSWRGLRPDRRPDEVRCPD